MFVRMKPWYKHPILSNILRVAVTVLLIWLVSKRVDLKEIAKIFNSVNTAWFVMAIIIYGFSLFVSSHRSAIYLRGIGILLRPWNALGLYMKGTVYNVLLPGGIGGDGYKILVLRTKDGPAVKQIFQAFFFERLSGLWAICTLLCVLNTTLESPILPPLWAWLAIAFGTIGYYIIMRMFFSEHATYFLRTHLMSLGIQTLVSIAVVCILKSQPMPVAYGPYLLSFHGSTIFSILNIGLSGLGVREFAMGYAAHILQNDAALSVFVASAFWLVSTITAIPGLGFLFVKRIHKQEVTNR
jgi:uncharacterized membrane protein YbhN (UPF0104 family)